MPIRAIAPPNRTELTTDLRQVEFPDHGFSPLDVVRWDGTTWQLAASDAIKNAAQAIVTQVTDANNFEIRWQSILSVPGHGFSGTLFHSNGAISNSPPPDGLMQILGRAIDADQLFLSVQPPVEQFEFKGIYSETTEYKLGDRVSSGNSLYLYISTIPSVGTPLSNTTYWQIQRTGKVPVGTPGTSVKRLPDRRVTSAKSERVYLMTDNSLRACGGGATHGTGDPHPSPRAIPQGCGYRSSDRPAEIVQLVPFYYGIAVRDIDGNVFVLGENTNGTLGQGDLPDRTALTRITFLTDNALFVRDIFAPKVSNASPSLFFLCDSPTETGILYGVGTNSSKELVDGTTTNRSTPVRIGTLANIVEVARGTHDILALQSNGDLYAWGWNLSGALGLGHKTGVGTPTLTHSNVAKVRTTGGRTGTLWASFSFILLTDGTVKSTGRNRDGGLGLGTTTDASTWTQISGEYPEIANIIIGGGETTIAFLLSTAGELFGAGYNLYGGLGLGNTTARSVFTKITSLPPIKNVLVGGDNGNRLYVLAEDTNGKLWTWGWGTRGAVAHATNFLDANPVPKQIMGIPPNATIQDYRLFGMKDSSMTGIEVLLADGRVLVSGGGDEAWQQHSGAFMGNNHNIESLKQSIIL